MNSAQWVPKLLYPDQFQTAAEISMEILNNQNQRPEALLRWMRLCNKIWLYQDNCHNKAQSRQWLPRTGSGPAKADRSRAKVISRCRGSIG